MQKMNNGLQTKNTKDRLRYLSFSCSSYLSGLFLIIFILCGISSLFY